MYYAILFHGLLIVFVRIILLSLTNSPYTFTDFNYFRLLYPSIVSTINTFTLINSIFTYFSFVYIISRVHIIYYLISMMYNTIIIV